MPDYRRANVPGGIYFLTLVTFNRQPIFGEPVAVAQLRRALAEVKHEAPFLINAAVVLPDHIHNPDKHGLVPCPHLWPYSSFMRWMRGVVSRGLGLHLRRTGQGEGHGREPGWTGWRRIGGLCPPYMCFFVEWAPPTLLRHSDPDQYEL